MRKTFRWLSFLVWIPAVLVLESRVSAPYGGIAAASEDPSCGVAAQGGGKSFDANTMTCVGSGDDCRGIAI